MSDPLRVVAFLEAGTVTGPAKNLMRFCQRVRAGNTGQRIEITLATLLRGEGRNQFLDAADAMGIPVDVVEEKGRFDVGVIEGMRNVLRQRAPHIVQTHAVKSGFLARLGGLGQQAKWVAFHHGYTNENLKVKLYNQLNRWSLKGAQRVVTVCQPFADQLARTGLKREVIEVLPNAIEDYVEPAQALVDGLKEKWRIGGTETILLTVGRLSREKGHIYLIEALTELRKLEKSLEYRLVLVGDGPERKTLEEATVTAGLKERIVFTGHQKDVRPYFGCAEIFVLPSLTEGSPNVVLEAMAAGKPIVATAVGGVRETVGEEGVALLSEARDAKGMAGNLLQVMQNKALGKAMGERGKQRVRAFSPEAYEMRLRAIYDRVMHA